MADQKALDLANRVVDKMPSDKKQIGIVLIVQIAAALVALFVQCRNLHNNKTELLRRTRNPTLLQRLRMRRQVRRQLRKDHSGEDVDTVVNAMVEAGKTATESDIETLVKLATPQN